MKFPSDEAVAILSVYSEWDFGLRLNLSNIMITTLIKNGEMVRVHEKSRTIARSVQSLKSMMVSKTVIDMSTNREANEAVLQALANK